MEGACVHAGWVVFWIFVAFVVGVLWARNINIKDREYWEKLGREASDRLAEQLKKYEDTYGSAQFVTHGKLRYGEQRFMRVLDHLEMGGFQ